MKYFTLLLLLIPMIGISDPRINVRNNTCHFPIDPLDPNEELNASSCGGVVVESGGLAAGYAEDDGIIHVTILPLAIQPTTHDPVVITVNWKDLPNTTCKLIDANNQKYNASRWFARLVLKRIKRTLPNGTEILTPRVKWSARLRCLDGAPPAATAS